MQNSYKVKIEMDIKEIEEVLNPCVPFDRAKAENIIRKHNLTDKQIGVLNSPLNPGYIPFSQATDAQIRDNLKLILIHLIEKLGVKKQWTNLI